MSLYPLRGGEPCHAIGCWPRIPMAHMGRRDVECWVPEKWRPQPRHRRPAGTVSNAGNPSP
eukprot:115951-Lingulodinium_polyedra.AAC.1